MSSVLLALYRSSVGLLLLTDFSTIRPIRTVCPERRPCSAYTTRHVFDIDDDQASIICLFALNTYARSTVRCTLLCGHSHLRIVPRTTDQTVIATGIRDEPIGGIDPTVEVEGIEEAGREVIGLQSILRGNEAGDEDERQGKMAQHVTHVTYEDEDDGVRR